MSWFGRKKPPPIRSLICEGTAVQGQLRFVEGLRIDGDVIGDVCCEGDGRSMPVISENVRVVGKVKAGHVIINEKMRSTVPVHASDLLEL